IDVVKPVGAQILDGRIRVRPGRLDVEKVIERPRWQIPFHVRLQTELLLFNCAARDERAELRGLAVVIQRDEVKQRVEHALLLLYLALGYDDVLLLYLNVPVVFERYFYSVAQGEIELPSRPRNREKKNQESLCHPRLLKIERISGCRLFMRD